MGASARVVGVVAVALGLAPARASADPPRVQGLTAPSERPAESRQPEERVTPPTGEGPSTSLVGAPRTPVTRYRDTDPRLLPPPVPFGVPTPISAGWRDDRFFVSTPSYDWFISPGGRLQLDFQTFAPLSLSDNLAVVDPATGATGSAPSPLRTGFQVRRARIELVGGVLSFLTWQLGAEFTDNGPQTAADLLLNLRFRTWMNLQMGQFDAPFTMENRTSDRYLDFVERSLTVRALGVPTNKEVGLMFWGEDARRLAHWSAGVFNGGGPGQFTPTNQVEGMARVFFHPFIVGHPLGLGRYLQVGASARVGSRSLGAQSAYPAMLTPAGYTLFDATPRPDVTIVARGLQWAVAAELVLPLDRVELRGEFVYVRNQTGEVDAPAGASLARDPARVGALEGYGLYAQLAFWLVGLPGTVPPSTPTATAPRTDTLPGYQDPPTLRPARSEPLTLPLGLQLLLRFETVNFTYRSASLAGAPPAALDASGRYRVHAVELGLNLWLTRHARLLVDYRHYVFPGGGGATSDAANRMAGPAGHEGRYGEFTTRLALNL
ncbi:MAG: hypothetical protein JWM10_4498 [Myxococcaceae bacterium]|nr:hypothetical protein [Myxococcaceae bacterium]